MRKRKRALFLFRVGGSLALLYYVFVHSDIVELPLLYALPDRFAAFLVSIPFFTASTLACATRWRLILKAQQFRVSYRGAVEITMISYFFRTFLPWSVGADLLKAWYIPAPGFTKRMRLAAGILVDRALGLAGILLCAALALSFSPALLARSEELLRFTRSVWALAFLAAGLLAVGAALWRSRKLVGFKSIMRLQRQFAGGVGTAGAAVLLSVLSVASTAFAYAIHGAALGIEIPLATYLVFVPLTIVASAVPLLPIGIGVGQIAFYNLFLLAGIPQPDRGATLCTLLQAHTLLFNLAGAFFYVKAARESAISSGEQQPS